MSAAVHGRLIGWRESPSTWWNRFPRRATSTKHTAPVRCCTRALGAHRCGSAGLASIQAITAASVRNPAAITSSCQFATGLRVFPEATLAGINPKRHARHPRACPCRCHEPLARPAENPTQSSDQHRDCQRQPCHRRQCGRGDCGCIPVPAGPVKYPDEGARRVQDRLRGYEKDVAAGGSTYTHPQNRQRPGRAPDPARPRPRPESPDHRPRLPANIRSRSASGRDGMIHAERPLPYQASGTHTGRSVIDPLICLYRPRASVAVRRPLPSLSLSSSLRGHLLCGADHLLAQRFSVGRGDHPGGTPRSRNAALACAML